MTHAHAGETPVVPYRTLALVWAALLALTALLAGASAVSPRLAVAAMLTLTPVKAALVVYYYMNLRYEGPLVKVALSVALVSLVLFIGMTFLDTAFR